MINTGGFPCRSPGTSRVRLPTLASGAAQQVEVNGGNHPALLGSGRGKRHNLVAAAPGHFYLKHAAVVAGPVPGTGDDPVVRPFQVRLHDENATLVVGWLVGGACRALGGAPQ